MGLGQTRQLPFLLNSKARLIKNKSWSNFRYPFPNNRRFLLSVPIINWVLSTLQQKIKEP